MNDKRRLTIVLSGGFGDCLLASSFVRHFDETDRYDCITCALPEYAVQLYDCSPRVSRLAPCNGRYLWLWGLPEDGADVFVPYARVSPDESKKAGFRVDQPYTLNQGVESAVRRLAAIHGLFVMDESPEIFTSAADEVWAENTLRQCGKKKRILISYHTLLVEKQYPLARWQEIVNALRGEALIFELTEGSPMMSGTNPIHPMPGPRQSAALIRRCDCVISIDSFAAHLAAAVGTPAVVLFGPTNPAVWGHPTARCIRATACPVCADTPRLRNCERHSCMDEISASLVIETVRHVLAQDTRDDRLNRSGTIS